MSQDQTTPEAWEAEYLAAFVRIAVERGYWTAEDAAPWADSCAADACAACWHQGTPPAEVADVDVDICARESAA